MFKSFFLAGFEGTTGYNAYGQWIDQVVATQHDRFVDEDYQRLREVGITAAREVIRWPLVDRGGRLDFATVRPFLDAARRHGIEIIFDLFHFGYPEDVDLFSEVFPLRFADYCYAAARYVAAHSDGPYYFTPVNEPSYFSWAAGEARLFAPHSSGRGWDLKVCLLRAAIAGINAIWAAVPEARIVNVDALCRVVAPSDRPDLQRDAEGFNSAVVFQGWDMLSGRLLPELGGSQKHLGIVGLNYYWTNQWEIGRTGIPLRDEDPRRWPLRDLVSQTWKRYNAEILIAETSHRDKQRATWLRELTREAKAMLRAGLPLGGICLYPILGMPEWHAPQEWTRMGLWDLVPQSPTLARIPYMPMIEALREATDQLAHDRFNEVLVGLA